jgi:hypothetical protein
MSTQPSVVSQTTDTVDYFHVYRCSPELVFSIRAIDDGQSTLAIAIAALGGGTLGCSYANNRWIYSVHLDSDLIASGVDLQSGGIAQTHAQMAAVLASCLATNPGLAPLLAGQADRLAATW